MLYVFKSKAGADVTMLSETGDALLRLMGREPAARGIFQAADLAGLMQALQSGVVEDDARFQRAVEEARAAGEPEPRRPGVSLRQRAWPLLELMQRADREQTDVVWGV